MRKMNSTFKTQFISEEGSHLVNRDYFAFVELDQLACYVIADGLDDDKEQNSAEIVVTTILSRFTEAPTMRKRGIQKYLLEAHRALGSLKDGMQLKASVTIIITNYVKYRYCIVGNTRFALFRNDRFIVTSKDQSLTRNLIQQDRLELDKASLHEERNNLYSYLGMKGLNQFEISPKLKFSDGDIFLLFSRGLWEYCDDGELLDCVSEAKEPQEIINTAEEVIMAKQPVDLDNYTLAVTFVDKIYRKPKKRWSIKRILMIAIPIILIIATLLTVWIIRRNKRAQQVSQMNAYIESAEKYSSYDNYLKASDEYAEALKLAKTLKKDASVEEIDKLKRLFDQILLGDEATNNEDYLKAEEAYYKALEMSAENGNIAKNYLESQISRNSGLKDVFDLLEQGDALLDLEDYEGARARYVDAKALAGQIFYQAGKQEAVDKIAAVDQRKAEDKKDAKEQEQAEKEEEAKKKEEEEAKLKEEEEKKKEEDAKAEEELKAKEQERLSAIEMEKQGNTHFDLGDYTNALLYYHSAREMYLELGMDSRYDALTEKMLLTQSMENSPKEKSQEDVYIEAADNLVNEKKYQEAVRLYELAIDSYRKKGDAEQMNKIQQKVDELTPLLK